MPEENIILNHQQILQKINRIAYQIYEDHYDQKEIILAGIAKSGYTFAAILKEKLESISSIRVELIELHIDKKNPLSKPVELPIDKSAFKQKTVIVVDDVLNSGKAMIYGLKAFLDAPLKSLSIAVLVNRSHNRYPLHADYVGLSLATTLKEHIEVSFEKKNAYQASLS